MRVISPGFLLSSDIYIYMGKTRLMHAVPILIIIPRPVSLKFIKLNISQIVNSIVSEVRTYIAPYLI